MRSERSEETVQFEEGSEARQGRSMHARGCMIGKCVESRMVKQVC